MGGRGHETYLLGPLVELATDLDQGGEHIGFLLTSQHFYLKMEAKSNFQNVVVV
jgi:hypothetical protein